MNVTFEYAPPSAGMKPLHDAILKHSEFLWRSACDAAVAAGLNLATASVEEIVAAAIAAADVSPVVGAAELTPTPQPTPAVKPTRKSKKAAQTESGSAEQAKAGRFGV